MLTDTQIRQAKGTGKAYRLYDERGLYLEVSPPGGKLWRFKYHIGGKEKRIGLGRYPDVSLSQARERREESRKLVARGIDPSAQRQAERAAVELAVTSRFEVVAREWIEKNITTWSPTHAKTVLQRLEKDIFPWLGDRLVGDITAPELLAVIRKVELRGAVETAHRELAICGQVFRYAIATNRAERDPSGDLRGALTPVQNDHFSAITDPKRLGQVLRMFDGYSGGLVVKSALRLTPLLFVRPGELRRMEWSEIDFSTSEWRYFVTKTKTDQIVPLSNQAIAILRELHPLTGHQQWVFPGRPGRPMSENGVLAALRALGIESETTGHGFRATARTLLDEVLGFRPELIEQQLAHAVRDSLGRAYNRTKYLDERKRMMQAWADYLDKLRDISHPMSEI